MSRATAAHTSSTFSSDAYLRELMEQMNRAAISDRLQQSREQAGLDQKEIADLLHVSYRTVQTWESRKIRTVPWDYIDDWAEITGVTRRWLLHGEEAPEQGTGAVDQLRAEFREESQALRESLLRLEDALRAAIDRLDSQDAQDQPR